MKINFLSKQGFCFYYSSLKDIISQTEAELKKLNAIDITLPIIIDLIEENQTCEEIDIDIQKILSECDIGDIDSETIVDYYREKDCLNSLIDGYFVATTNRSIIRLKKGSKYLPFEVFS